jgi:hypothetical protein
MESDTYRNFMEDLDNLKEFEEETPKTANQVFSNNHTQDAGVIQ